MLPESVVYTDEYRVYGKLGGIGYGRAACRARLP